ncbi:uncharacterized protein LOC126909621 [Daktulosphaira vitifoliae]|uniref:uncharacterized protein LOC126909621 n=1 Tax=Daktulosphaira vitifoliae TaxID=58002 RepID=UPI0021A9B8FA|nr:uncharacterized protein LOC126909621 [Daktulosphaira vitifoliae]
MDDTRDEFPNARECREQQLRDFVSKYKDLKCLWDIRCKDYSNRDKKKDAYSELLVVYKLIKPDASIDDVKKKINTLRSNFRKELKKIHESKRSGAGADDIYQPSSWLFEELAFLADLEKPVDSTSSINDDTNNEKVPNNESSEAIQQTKNAVPTFIRPLPKKSKSTISQQNELLSLACNYLTNEENRQDSDLDQAKVWANTLKTLTPNQKVFAQKAINDILFEAQLGTLHRNSVKINEEDCTRSSTPMTVNNWNENSNSTSQSQDYVLTQTNLQNFYGNWNGSDV